MSLKNKALGELTVSYESSESSCEMLYSQVNLCMKELLKELCQAGPFYYYKARYASSQEQLKQIIGEISHQYKKPVNEVDYEGCFRIIARNEKKPYIIIIDDFDRIVKNEPNFMEAISQLQAGNLGGPKVMILLCTTNVQWVKKTYLIEGKNIPQFIHNVQQLDEVKFLDVVRMFPSYSVRDCVEVYGILGGSEELLVQWESSRGLKFNVCKHILSSKGFLHNQVDHYLQCELRELSVYYTILSALASGHTKLNELHNYTGFSRPKISVYMKNLMAFDVIEKIHSFETGGWENAKKGIYRIRNTYIDFWFSFIYPNLSALELEEPEDYYVKYIEPGLSAYLENYFAKVCMEYFDLVNEIGKLPIQVSKMGTWVGKQGNIDIIAQDSIRNSIVGKCNWSSDIFTYEMYEELLQTMKMAKIKSNYCFLFSAQKFEAKLIRASQENDGIVLVDMNQL